jgi:hypothetical protein
MTHFRAWVVSVLLIAVPVVFAVPSVWAASGKANGMRFSQMESKDVDEEIAVLESELESAALDAVLIDAEPGDKIFEVDANAARAAKVER